MVSQAAPLPHLHALILAGGSGTRFWPLSRELAPKQMLTLFGEGSLLGDTILRIEDLAEHVHVLSSDLLADEIQNHVLSDSRLKTSNAGQLEVLAEPMPKNTAFAVALAAAHLYRLDPEAIMIVLPSDHLLKDDAEWRRAVQAAYAAACGGALVTFGLTPTRVETGFGYIRPGDPAATSDAYRVAQFVEKPNEETAQHYIDEGYLWNSGMFMMQASAVLEEFSRTGLLAATRDSQDNALIRNAAEDIASRDCWTDEAARTIASTVPSVPFDKAVLEVSDNVVVVPAKLEWSDVGSLSSLDALSPADESGNRIIGRGVNVDSENVTSYSDGALVATLGLKDVVVVDTPDAVLVADKNRAQDVRLVVDALKAQGAEETTRSRKSVRPWGSWALLVESPGHKVKRIEVLPGKRLSLQSHERRSEHWIVVAGEATIEQGATVESLETKVLQAGKSTFLPAHAIHRLANEGTEMLVIIEIAVGDYLGEDDIVRYEDDWAR